MTRLQRVGALYEASARLSGTTSSMSLFVAGDPEGAELQSRMQGVVRLQLGDEIPQVKELLAIGRIVRWRDLVQPTPDRFDRDLDQIFTSLQRLSFQLDAVLDEASADACRLLVESVRQGVKRRSIPAADLLLSSLREVADEDCVLTIAVSGARQRVIDWLTAEQALVPVHGVGSLMGISVASVGYFLGPPSLFGTRVVTAPRCLQSSFVIPSWCADRRLPRSELSSFAVGAIRPKAQVFVSGESETASDDSAGWEESLAPQPIWSRPGTPGPVGEDEVPAREVQLAGHVTLWLDKDGDSIRTLDPDEAVGHRVELRPVASIRAGSFLVYREGETESEALLRLAYQELGGRAELVRSRQEEWKELLRHRLAQVGTAEAARQLRDCGVAAAGQVRSWSTPTVVRPRSDEDFQHLLEWLKVGVSEHLEMANILRSARLRAANRVTRALELALGKADMNRLQEQGELMVELGIEGFAAMTAGRVLAISPHEVAVPRHDLRIPRRGGTSQWLE